MKNGSALVPAELRGKIESEERNDDKPNIVASAAVDIKPDDNDAPARGSADSRDVSPLALRLPAGIDIGQTLYIRLARNGTVRADKVMAITIRENNVGIVFRSGREINADEIGSMILLNADDVGL